MLFSSLNKKSISQLFAFYKAYPNSTLGEQARTQAWELINLYRDQPWDTLSSLLIPDIHLMGLVSLINGPSKIENRALSKQHLLQIQQFSSHLANRKLEGFNTLDKERVVQLPTEQIDLSRAMLLFSYDESSPDFEEKILQFEATLDLMALQILAYLPKNATALDKIRTINQFIFFEQGFRFPPHSLWAQDIHTYTFLPSVLDSRKGVCLGVSILYLSLAQRLDLPLEIITPPGHIYIRYKGEKGLRNIETTARGIHLPSYHYLGINTRNLQKRTMKEVVGLAFINQASVSWQAGHFDKTIDLYKKASLFIHDNPLLNMLLGYNHLFVGETDKGTALLKTIVGKPFDHACTHERTPEDFIQGKVDGDSIRTLFTSVDDSRESIVRKKDLLQSVIKKYPLFRDGYYQLGVCYLQLSQLEEAYNTLLSFHKIDNSHPVVEYYLSMLCLKKYAYSSAWKHFYRCQKLLKQRKHSPYCLKQLAQGLRQAYPDPLRHKEAFFKSD